MGRNILAVRPNLNHMSILYSKKLALSRGILFVPSGIPLFFFSVGRGRRKLFDLFSFYPFTTKCLCAIMTTMPRGSGWESRASPSPYCAPLWGIQSGLTPAARGKESLERPSEKADLTALSRNTRASEGKSPATLPQTSRAPTGRKTKNKIRRKQV